MANIGDMKMAKSKVDTKALDEVNGVEATITSDNVGGTAIYDMATEAVELLVTAFGTNDRTAKALARQLCSATHFLLNGSETYNGIRHYVMQEQTNVTEAEDKVKKDVANAEAILDSAKERLNVRETEEADMQALHNICCEVFKTETGETWQPYSAGRKAVKKPLSRAERLANKGFKVVK
tara:strand:+ start:302 stop:841 length:540 start_codon:yes stop_codon:yes gene_type:complete